MHAIHSQERRERCFSVEPEPHIPVFRPCTTVVINTRTRLVTLNGLSMDVANGYYIKNSLQFAI